MKLVAISGTQGSGKTSLIRSMVSRLTERGASCGVIVNEDGAAKYDPDFVQAHGLVVKTLQGG